MYSPRLIKSCSTSNKNRHILSQNQKSTNMFSIEFESSDTPPHLRNNQLNRFTLIEKQNIIDKVSKSFEMKHHIRSKSISVVTKIRDSSGVRLSNDSEIVMLNNLTESRD